MESNGDVSAELAAVSASRQNLADRLYTPWWYHPVLGVFCGGLILVIGDTLTFGLFLLPFLLIGIIGLGPLYRRLSGIDLFGANAPDGGPKGRSILAALMACLVLTFAGSYLLGRYLEWDWAPWVLAIVVVTTVIAAGRSYDGALRAHLRGPGS